MTTVEYKHTIKDVYVPARHHSLEMFKATLVVNGEVMKTNTLEVTPMDNAVAFETPSGDNEPVVTAWVDKQGVIDLAHFLIRWATKEGGN
jgi:hypothetical protein